MKRLFLLGLCLWCCLFTACAGEEAAAPESQPGVLVVGSESLSGSFDPFFSTNASDYRVVQLTGLPLLTTDRQGGVVYEAIAGETHAYQGTDYLYTGPADLAVDYDATLDQTSYTWTLRDDLRFSDGEPLTADDLLFTYYVLCDPSYDGPATLGSLPILGLDSYRLQVPQDEYQRLSDEFAAASAGARDAQSEVWQLIDAAWRADLQSIVDYCLDTQIDLAEDYTGFTSQQILDPANRLQVMFAMYMWAFGDFDAQGAFVDASGVSYDLAQTFPELDDFLSAAQLAYDYDAAAYSQTESLYGSVWDSARDEYILAHAAAAEQAVGIAGLEKLSERQVRVTLAGSDASAVHALDVYIAPLHYYGDPALFDYERNSFGFTMGDLSQVRARLDQPLGAGPYQFVAYENKVVQLQANEYYYAGQPKISQIQLKETPSGEQVAGLASGLLDLTETALYLTDAEEIAGYNDNQQLSGDQLVTLTTDALGFGYIGLNAATVNVGGDPFSPASLALRQGLATVLSVYRQLAVSSYFGDMARVIEYPISAVSWAAPQPTDADYRIAYALDADGAAVYQPQLSDEQRAQAALQAAISLFKQAGYTWDEAAGRFTAAPAGASLSYELLIPGEGVGDHPALLLGTQAAQALASVGLELTVTDLSDETLLWDLLASGGQELWCAGLDLSLDPDLYPLFHSQSIGQMNYFALDNAQVDDLIIEARVDLDDQLRRSAYGECLNLIMDQAVIVPFYQRQDGLIFSPQRLNQDTLTPDITSYWPWYREIEQLELR